MSLYGWLVQMADGGDTGPVGDIIVGGNICFVLVEWFFLAQLNRVRTMRTS